MNCGVDQGCFSDAQADGAVSRPVLRWGLLGVALLALLLWNLGNRGLNEPDEGRYANIADEMRESEHGWWEPRVSDFAHYDKPPLIYWTTALAFEAFGRNEWAARFPSTLGAVMVLAGLGWAAWRLYGSRVAWWAVLCCGTLGQFWVLARMLTPDMLLAGFVTLAIGFWAEERHRGARGIWWWGCAVCWTLGWWTKATAALVPLLGLVLGLLASRDQTGLRSLRPLRLLLLVVAAGAPWYVELMHRHPELEGFFFGRELAGRVLGHPDGRRGPIYYHAAFSVIGWAPWWPMALAALVARRRELLNCWRQRRWPGVPLEAWMVFTGVTFFSLLSSKLVTYTLPFAPWMALLCARILIARPGPGVEARRDRGWLAVAGACAAVFVTASYLIPHWQSRLGASSTLREVGRQLRNRNASVVYEDRFSPGLEFYFGESVFYVTDHIPRELPSDLGCCAALGESHFLAPSLLASHLRRHATNDVWFVRYRVRANSPLTRALSGITPRQSLRVGEFTLDCVPAMAIQETPQARGDGPARLALRR